VIPYLLIIPGRLVIAVLTFYPLYQVVVMAFHELGLAEIRPRNPRPAEFVGCRRGADRAGGGGLDRRNFFISQRSTDIRAIMAASTLMTIPVVIFFLIVQRRLVSGLVAGAVKG
jgi:ABC-type sugar transport system permease subunit